MTYMTKKTQTIPFGAELPPPLIELFDGMVTREGWTKKRALAAAVRAFITADHEVRRAHYLHAYAPVKSIGGATPAAAETVEELRRIAARPPRQPQKKRGAG